MPLTTESFAVAWKVHQDRCNVDVNQQVITSATLQRFLNPPSITSASSSVCKFHDNTNECILALTNIALDISSWDPIFMQLPLRK